MRLKLKPPRTHLFYVHVRHLLYLLILFIINLLFFQLTRKRKDRMSQFPCFLTELRDKSWPALPALGKVCGCASFIFQEQNERKKKKTQSGRNWFLYTDQLTLSRHFCTLLIKQNFRVSEFCRRIGESNFSFYRAPCLYTGKYMCILK